MGSFVVELPAELDRRRCDMAVWTIPAKILLPAWMFEGQIGRLPNGHQVLGYVSLPAPWSAAVHVFDSEGHHLATHAQSGLHAAPTATDRVKTAREALRVLLEPLKAGGWEDADIWVRPFSVIIDGTEHGLVCAVEGDDPSWDDEFDPQTVRLFPFGFYFHRPWDNGSYDS
jgi:hypothetical protein